MTLRAIVKDVNVEDVKVGDLMLDGVVLGAYARNYGADFEIEFRNVKYVEKRGTPTQIFGRLPYDIVQRIIAAEKERGNL